MIVQMSKVFVVCRAAEREALVDTLGELGVLHLAPVDASRAGADEKVASALDRVSRAIQVLEGFAPAGATPSLEPIAAAEEVLQIQREAAEKHSRLATLHRQIDQLEIWGDVRLEQFEILRSAGVTVNFYTCAAEDAPGVRGEFVQQLGGPQGKRVLLAAVTRDGVQPELPESAQQLELPQRDRPSIRAEAARLDQELAAGGRRLGELAHLLGELRSKRAELAERADWTAAERSGLARQSLFAVQGWVPSPDDANLAAMLAERGLHAAVQTMAPADDEQPPTKIQYPRWVRPIKGLFDMLGTVPGYREMDVSWVFMIAFPLFAAILISDAGYGMAYLLLPIIFYRKLSRKAGPELAQLLIVIGAASVAWGVLSMSFLGFTPDDMRKAGGIWASIADVLTPLWVIRVEITPESQHRLMLLSFTIAVVQLCLAHILRARSLYPSLAAIAEVGWAVFAIGMYGVVKMFVLKDPLSTPYLACLIGGGALALFFASPNRNIVKMLGLGLANFPLTAIGAFGDTVSYVRLMAVGLAGTALAVAFNDMGFKAGALFALIFVVGHSLNIALSIVSLFAHGVRLNMLEFSNNLGMQWTGYAYKPFSKNRQES